MLVRAAERLSRATARWVPSAFSIAVLLTLLTLVLAVTWGGATLTRAVRAWGDGIWSLLEFSMRMALVMFTGYLLALSTPVKRLLERLASFATSPRGAVAWMAFLSMALAWVNWGLSLVGSALLVRWIVRRQPAVDYRLLVAAAYFGMGATWHAGLSASAPLLVASPKHDFLAMSGVVTVDRTLFTPFNLGLTALSMLVLCAVVWLAHPAAGKAVTVDPALLGEESEPAPHEAPASGGFATRLDRSPLLNALFVALALAWLLRHLLLASLAPDRAAALGAAWNAGELGVALPLAVTEGIPAVVTRGWRLLNIDLVNFLFLTLAVALHRTPASLLAASERAASVLHGIVLQFPLYAGIFGIFKGTALTARMSEAFVGISTPATFPALVYWYSGIVNYFVPSGGSKWAIEAPYLLEAGKTLGVPPEKVVLAYAWGDMATDLIQPFWALPLMAMARIEFREMFGFLLLAFLVYAPLVTLAFLVAA